MKLLIFVWWDEFDYGVVLTKERYEFLLAFDRACSRAETWQQFAAELGATWTEYVSQFACDVNGEVRHVKAADSIDALSELFIFSNEEFPLVQCVQETYQEFAESLPINLGYAEFETEFGMPLRLYKKSRFVELKSHLEHYGLLLEPIESTQPMSICDYKSGPVFVDET